jgi:putative ABC transport system permease protein
MLKSLIRYSIRSFKRQRSYIIINILGLSIGIACSLLITLFVINEAGYDRYNVNRDRIFRIVLNGKIGGQEVIGAFTPSIMGPTMLREVPEVEDYLRMTGRGPTIVEYDGQTFTEEGCIEADSSFFNFLRYR